MQAGLRAHVPVRMCTRRNCLFIRWFLREKLAMPGGMDSERTNELAYLAKLLLNPLVKLAMPVGIDCQRTSVFA